MGTLFGTDGVRGVANRDLAPELALKLGRAGAHLLNGKREKASMVIGRDTRASGDMLEAALTAGICSVGVDVLKVGIMPTPAIAYLTRQLNAIGGVVISASHNPVEDNGIKFFGANGYKLPDEVEEEIEKLITGGMISISSPEGGGVGRAYEVKDAAERYLDFAKETVELDLTGMKIVVDCANGAACHLTPRILKELGAEVISAFCQPNGVNINVGCGSTNPGVLKEMVVKHGADLGLAHDGDADRLIAVDAAGNVVDGDQIMLICAKYLKSCNRLAGNTAVVTVMSNLGLKLALEKYGVKVIETQVGDRYVLEELMRNGARFGGEQSGHIIFLDLNTTGDGILTALQLLAAIKYNSCSLGELAGEMEKFPQFLENVLVADKVKVIKNPLLAEAIRQQEKYLSGQGRILVRPSGTEPVIRVMGEGRDPIVIRKVIQDLVKLIRELA